MSEKSETNITGDIHGNAYTGEIDQIGDRTVNASVYIEHASILQTSMVKHSSPDLMQATADYLQWLIDRNLYLDPRGTFQTQRQVMVKLEEVYVSLRAESEEWTASIDRGVLENEWIELEHRLLAEGLSVDEIEEQRDLLLLPYTHSVVNKKIEQPLTVEFETAIKQHPLIVILGDPGSGKTTLIRYLALHAAKLVQQQVNEQGESNALFPIFLRIADYVEGDRWKQTSLSDFIADAYVRQECPSRDLADLLYTKLDSGGCIVLLDGLDEILNADIRRSIVQRIEDFVRRYQRGGLSGENRFVVTSRVAGYRSAPLGLGFAHFTVKEMEQHQIRLFLEKWCRAVEDANAPDISEIERQRLAEREVDGIMHAVTSTPGVRRLAANPLMLRTLALIHRTGAQLPQRRIELYKLAAETLERTWRTAQGVSESELSALLRGRELPGLLGALAYWIHENKSTGIATEREVEAVLGKEWARLRRLEWDPDDPDPAILDEIVKFLNAVREHTGLFVERAPRRYGFMHLTFEEYYAARYLVARVRRAAIMIRKHLHDPRWQEPILLGLGFVALDYPEDAADLLETAILAKSEEAHDLGFIPSKHESVLKRDYLFALRCLANQIPAHPETLDRLLAQFSKDLTAQSFLARFQRYRQSIAQKLDDLVDSSHAKLIGTYMAAALEHEETSVRLRSVHHLGHLGKSDPESAIALIRALDDPSVHVRIRAADQLGRLGQSSQKTVSVLSSALTHEDSDARIRAADSLGCLISGTSNSELITALINALTHWDVNVRYAAADSLNNMSEGRSDIIVALAELLVLDNVETRFRAADSLVRLGNFNKYKSEVVSALTHGLSHQDVEVQIRSANALSGLGFINPEVVDALLGALTHVDAKVSYRAADSLGSLGRSVRDTYMIVDKLMAILDQENVTVSYIAAHSLIRLGVSSSSVITRLSDALNANDPLIRFRAVDSFVRLVGIGELGADVIKGITDSLTHEDVYVRHRAINNLNSLRQLNRKNMEVIKALVNVLMSKDAQQRFRAADSLGRLGEKGLEVVKALNDALSDEDDHVRIRAADSLAWIGENHSEITSVLVTALGQSDLRLSYTAAYSLVCLNKVSQHLPDLCAIWHRTLNSDDWRMRAHAVKWLAEYSPSPELLLPVLRKMLLDPDNDVRTAVATGLMCVVDRYPDLLKEVEKLLLEVIQDQRFEATDNRERMAQDYAYNILWMLYISEADDKYLIS